jgi:tRNA nucleotidyltransferase/poly(A) polymerase
MSNYMFMLENHLNAGQNAALAAVQAAATGLDANLFLAGGAMRDMLGGFPIRDLDFVVEGSASKVAKAVAHAIGAEIVATDEVRKTVELVFGDKTTVQIGTARQERFPKPGAKPHVTPAGIHEHLRSRDFTLNAIALSLSRASRGLLIDPTNGVADIDRREIRAVSNYTLYDEPVRLFRLLRLKTRLGYEVAERTRAQYENARAANVEKYLSAEGMLDELRRAASEPDPGAVLQLWDQEKLLVLLSPAIAGPKLNVHGLARLHKARQVIPSDPAVPVDDFALMLYVLTEKLSAKERSEFTRAVGIDRETADAFGKLETRAKKLEKDLGASSLHKASRVYGLLVKAPAELAVFLLMRTSPRVVHDRIRNYFQKYLQTAQEVTDAQVIEAGGTPGTPKFEKIKGVLIAKRLDARPKRAPEPPPEPAPPTPPAGRLPRLTSPV